MQGSTDTKFKLVVEYCDSCGYDRFYDNVQKAVSAKYPNALFEGVGVPGGTGCLEVKMFKDPTGTDFKLIHSKLAGDGVITTKNMNTFMGKVDSAIAE